MPGGKLELCRDSESENIEEIIVAVSNSSLEGQTPAAGEIKYKTRPTCGEASLTGTLTLTVTNESQPRAEFTAHVDADITYPEGETPVENNTATFKGEVSGTHVQINEEGEEEPEEYEGHYNLSPHGLLVGALEFPERVEVFVQLYAQGPTVTTGGTSHPEAVACPEGPGTVENYIYFSAGPYVIPTNPGGGAQTLHVENTQPYEFAPPDLGTDCIGLPGSTEYKWSGDLTWTPGSK